MEYEDDRVKTPSSPLTTTELVLRVGTLAFAVLMTIVSLLVYATAPIAIVGWLLFGVVVAVQIGSHRWSRHRDIDVVEGRPREPLPR